MVQGCEICVYATTLNEYVNSHATALNIFENVFFFFSIVSHNITSNHAQKYKLSSEQIHMKNKKRDLILDLQLQVGTHGWLGSSAGRAKAGRLTLGPV